MQNKTSSQTASPSKPARTRRGYAVAASLASALLIGGCGSSDIQKPPSIELLPDQPPQGRYELANRCFVMQAQPGGQLIKRSADGFVLGSGTADDADAFYVKPTALGRYLFFNQDRLLLTGDEASETITGDTDPSDGADWIVQSDDAGNYTISSRNAGLGVRARDDGTLGLDASPQTFRFLPAKGCTPYPEMPLDVTGKAYKGQGIDKPVIGFADAHTHMAMSSELSDGSGNIGPSAGGVLYGQMFNRFGVTEALKDCSDLHGDGGFRDPGFVVEGGAPNPHETQGWPTFVGWPVGSNITHQGMYYRWVERAYMAGLRVLVNLGTNIEALCQFGVDAGLGQPGSDCKDMSIGMKQIDYSYEMQDYVDAQAGGPGEGWFRIVTTPAEARQVINDGKLAVVLGLEFANMFECNVTFDPLGNETRYCDEAHIDQKIEEAWNRGVRQIYLYHDVNSALGGTGLFTFALDLVGYYGTQRFWETYDCPDVPYFAQDVEFPDFSAFYVAGVVSPAGVPGTGSDPLTDTLYGVLGGATPVLPPGPQCNQRGTTDLGHYALAKAMERGFVLDMDHAELTVKEDMMAAARAQTPPYPLVSMHGGHGGLPLDMAKELLDMGGLIFPYNPNGATAVSVMQELKKIWPAGRPLAMGYGFDGNGFGGMPEPRGATHPQISYPFTLFQGDGWGPQFAAAGIEPVTVDLLTIPESGKSWNADVDGEPHYGLVADLVEQVRLEGGEEAISALFNSAEAYLLMWEQVLNR